MNKQTIPIPVPEGFEWRGEYRSVLQHEYFMECSGEAEQWKDAEKSFRAYYILHPVFRTVRNRMCCFDVRTIYGRLPLLPEGFEDVEFGMKRPEGATHYMGTNFRVYPAKATELPICVIWLREVTV